MNDMRQLTPLGRAIEHGSFSVIDREVGQHSYSSLEWQIVRRIIHATADFEFAQLTHFHGSAITSGIAALRSGKDLVVDVEMIRAGLSKDRLQSCGCSTHCFISDDDVIAAARSNNTTRAIESIRKAHRLSLLEGTIVAIGNAPTALLELVGLIRADRAHPALIVGVPVGFVSAAEAKEELASLDIPFVVTRGRKGGSTIAVSIIHALLAILAEVTK